MIGNTSWPTGRWRIFLSGTALSFIVLCFVPALLQGWSTGMAVTSGLRFLLWFLRGLVVLSALMGLGWIVSRLAGWESAEKTITERLATRFVAGWALICLCGILSLAFGAFSPLLWIFLFLPGMAMAVIGGINQLRKLRRNHLPFPEGLSLSLSLIPLSFLVSALLAGAVLMASVPPDSRDELAYHLLLPQQWAQSGSWVQPPGNPRLMFPANTEILFSWASTIAGEGSVRFLALAAALLCLALLIDGVKKPLARLLTLAFVLVTPMFLLSISIAYVEYFLALLILLGWRTAMTARGGSAGLTGLAWGLALGVKYTAIPLVGLLVLEALWKLGGRRKEQGKLLASFLVVTLLCAAPWYLRNFQVTGDLLYPFGTMVSAPDGSPAQEALVMTEFSPIPARWRLSPWLFHALENPLADEHLHPLWALLIPGVIFLGWKRRDLPWLSIAGMSLFFMLSRPACRVMIPAMIPACLWLPSFFESSLSSKWASMIWNLTLTSLAFIGLPFILGQWVVIDQGESLRYLSGEISAERYLEDIGAITPVMRFLSTQTPSTARVWVWGEDRALYLRRWVWVDLSYTEPYELLMTERGESALDEALEKWKIDYILVSQDQIAEDFSSYSLHGRSAEAPDHTGLRLRNWVSRRTHEIGRDQHFRLLQVH